MSTDWTSIILDCDSPAKAWEGIFSVLLEMARTVASPVALHDQTVVPDRLLSEAAWGLWHSYPESAALTSARLRQWCNDSDSTGRAVLILDAFSLRELPLLLGGAEARGVKPESVSVAGSECPSTTDQFAKALGVASRSALKNDGKPGTFALFDKNAFTDVVRLPFEDCAVPPTIHGVINHAGCIPFSRLLAGSSLPPASAGGIRDNIFF
jgi:hypothetical protein